MSRRLLRSAIVGAVAVLLGTGLRAQEPVSFRVIVHPTNPVGSLSRGEVSRLFLRQATRWQTGQRVMPVNLIAQSPLRQAFARQIHHKSLPAERAFWQRQIFSGRGVPPVEVATEQEVVNYVARHPGAVGYVSIAGLTAEVRPLEIRHTEASPNGAP